ncbi:biopolymer transporter ExbD [Mucilaginibacter gynuensis]|uniref:Biopolymer transporter ExbD n=1 Tax=Mucilaginibacter gynuensis TaxID=1302236 RepID=A0ABP8H743_9SPHI
MNLRKRHRGASAEVHTSAMNDIMFFLLLFFLIASTVTNPNVIKLVLPKSSSGQSVSKKTVTVSITKDLRYYVDKQEITIDQLEGILQQKKTLATELTIVLHVDETVAIQDVVQVMDIAQKQNIKLVLATKPKA